MEVRTLSVKNRNVMKKEVYDETLKKMRTEHDRLVRGVFEFTEAQGGWFEFTCRTFPGEPIISYKIYHGETTELPAGIVRLLRNCKKKIRKINPELGSRGVSSTFETISRVTFTPVDL